MVGDGAKNNNTAFQSVLTSASNGDLITLPCGVYKVNTSFAITISAGNHVRPGGSCQDCTELYFSGTTACIVFTFRSENSGLELRDITITTDDITGVNIGITLTSNATTVNGGAQNSFVNVTFRGHDGYGVNEYWGVGLSLNTASNVTIDRFAYFGKGTGNVGNGIVTSSTSATQFEAIVNITNSIFFECNKGFVYGAFVQGVTMSSVNFTDCNYGVYVPSGKSG